MAKTLNPGQITIVRAAGIVNPSTPGVWDDNDTQDGVWSYDTDNDGHDSGDGIG